MKKHLNLIAASAVLALAACTNDGLVNDNIDLGTSNDNRISFSMLSENMSKAVDPNRAEQKGHYEFGVFAYLNESPLAATTDYVMQNYLVAYGDNTNYTDKTPASSTYQTDENVDDQTNTVNANGLSSWFYEGLSSSKMYKSTPDNTQILKYWTVGTPTHFVAYMPYKSKESDVAKATIGIVDSKNILTVNGLSSFYTTPVVTARDGSSNPTAYAQVATINFNEAETTTDEEIRNYNEALYAYTSMTAQKAGTPDVPLNFKHMNAKIQLAFYELIDGYSVKLIDLRPVNAVSEFGEENKAVYEGIALTPATATDAAAQNQPDITAKYLSNGTMTVTNYATSPAIAVSSPADENYKTDNLRFQKPTADAAIATAGGESATILPTTYYALPQTQSSELNKTGYTLHVSFEMIPDDGSAHLKVYDARVFIPATECAWEAGKAYKYIFKITNKANGTTNPNEVDPYYPTTPWVDPVDPRVPEDPALQPIVFDGVVISEYEDAAAMPDKDITKTTINPETEWPSFKIDETTYYYNIAKSLVDNADVTGFTAYTINDLSSGITLTKNTQNNGVEDTSLKINFPAVNQTVVTAETTTDVVWTDFSDVAEKTAGLTALAGLTPAVIPTISYVYIFTSATQAKKYVIKPTITKDGDNYSVSYSLESADAAAYTGYGYVILNK